MMKAKLISGFVAVSLVVGGTGFYAINQHLQRLEQEKIQQNLDIAEEKVKALYNVDRTKLAMEISSKIEKANKAVSLVELEAEHNRLFKEIEDVRKLANMQEMPNELLVDGIIHDSITIQSIEDVRTQLLDIKTVNHAIFSYLLVFVDEASAQLVIFLEAEESVENAESSLEVDLYDAAINHVDQVKHKARKENLIERLELVKIELVAIEQQRKEQQEALAAQVEQEKQTKVNIQTQRESTVSNSDSNSRPSSKSTNSSSSKPNNDSSTTTKQENNSRSSNETNSGNTNWNEIGKHLENKEWEHKDSGEIDEDGNTWDYYD